jgi:hypothetical protein
MSSGSSRLSAARSSSTITATISSGTALGALWSIDRGMGQPGQRPVRYLGHGLDAVELLNHFGDDRVFECDRGRHWCFPK